MIESLQLHNYKAFDTVSIPIKPITIFLGANSVGKSSIIQMLMLLHQTAEGKTNNYSSALKIYGNYVNAGACENLFKRKNTASPLLICVEINSDDMLERIKLLKTEFIDVFHRISFFLKWKPTIEIDQIASLDTFSQYLTNFIDKLKKDNNTEKDSIVNYFIGEYLGISENEINNITLEEMLETYKFLDKLSQLSSLPIKISYNLVESDSVLKILSFDISTDSGSIIKIQEKSVVSDFGNLSSIEASSILRKFTFDTTIFDCFDGEESKQNKTALPNFICKTIDIILQEFKNNCINSQINYVSPLRAHPKRYYMLDKANTTISLNTLDGDEIAEVLKENKDVKNNVNTWFGKFGLKLDVNQFKEVVHNVNVTQNNLKLDITDVGFGISQVLPIIIQGFLSPTKSITIIEQPEIHLHPKMQADLGDLFIDIVQKKHKKIIIETHSEYLLRRIRRRISEGKISAEDVSICLFQPMKNGKGSEVEILQIAEKGSFQWPDDFYGGELYNDTTEFLKNQS